MGMSHNFKTKKDNISFQLNWAVESYVWDLDPNGLGVIMTLSKEQKEKVLEDFIALNNRRIGTKIINQFSDEIKFMKDNLDEEIEYFVT